MLFKQISSVFTQENVFSLTDYGILHMNRRMQVSFSDNDSQTQPKST